MADTDENPFGQELADAFEADEKAENPVAPLPAEDTEKKPEDGAADAPKTEEPKKDDPATPPADPNKKEDPATPPTDPAQKSEDGATPPTDPNAPPKTEEPVAPQPLTRDDLTEIVKKIQTDERVSGQDLEVATNDVMQAYYPEGLSNVLVDQASGKELKTPADVVAASGGTMEMEEAAQWLLNEQYKLDQNIEKIKSDAGKIAETTINFKRDSIAALEKYEPLFKAYPQLQAKIFDKMMKQVKADTTKNVILSAPDVMEYYDDYLEPYQQAYEQSTKQSATNPVTPPAGATETPPATPGVDDRMDEGGDGGATTDIDDPNDFAQQVNKELSRGL